MVQASLLRAYRAIGTLDSPEKFGSWLYGIAVRTCLDWLKAKERSQVSFDSLGPDRAPIGAPAGRLPEENEQQRKVLEAIEGLPEIYRETVVMFYFRKQKYQEMSALLGISHAAVNARLTKARALLRERLADAVRP